MHTVIEQLIPDLACDAEAGGSVLSVRDYQVDAMKVDDARQPAADELAPRLADDIADEEDAHGDSLHGDRVVWLCGPGPLDPAQRRVQ